MPKPIEKLNIVHDFSEKHSNYYELNYGIETSANYVRRLRRNLIINAVRDIVDGAIVLDAGCGPAILYPDVLDRCSKYVALDLVPANLKEISRTNPSFKIDCVLNDIDNFEWTPEAFDVIICSGAIEYTNKPELALLSMIYGLRHDGLLVCSFPNLLSPYRLWSELLYRPLSTIRHRLRGRVVNYYSRRLFSPKGIQRVVRAHARNIELKYLGYKLLPQPLDHFWEKLDFYLAYQFQRHPLGLFKRIATEFLVIARK